MKIRSIYTYTFILAMAILSMLSCSPDDGPVEPSLQELTFENLAGEWTLGQFSSIKLDGADVSANYSGFALSFEEGTYTTTNAGDLLSSSGTWEWVDTDATQVQLDDGKLVTINSLSTSKFIFSFNYSSRPLRAGVEGNYIITVEK